MKSHFYHIQVNINFKNTSFYKDLFTFLGWHIIFEEKDVVGYKSHTNGDMWFVEQMKSVENNYDGRGVNHISIRVEEQKNIDEMSKYLKKHSVTLLFDTPKHRPEFTDNKDETYYQIMFESPDKILFEIVYIGQKG